MDGQSLSQALVRLSGTDLRKVYALLCRTNLLHLLSTKTKDLLSSKESKHFSKHLEEEAAKLRGRTDEDIRLSLFLELTKMAKLTGTRYESQKEIEDKCQEIVDWAFIQFQKKDKDFLPFYKEKQCTKLEALINWQIKQILKEQQTKLSEKEIFEYINNLPVDQHLMVNYQNTSLRKLLMPIVLLLIVLPYFTDPVLAHYDTDLIANEWTSRLRAYELLFDELKSNGSEQEDLNRRIRLLEQALKLTEVEKGKREKTILSLRGNIKIQFIKDKNRPHIKMLSDDLEMYRKEIILLERKMVKEKSTSSGFLGSIKTTLKTKNHQTEIASLRRKMDLIHEEMVDKIIQGKVAYAQEYVFQIGELQLELTELRREISSLQIQLSRLSKDLSDLKTTENSIRKKIKETEAETYGLEYLALG
jgi:hypothetical protein